MFNAAACLLFNLATQHKEAVATNILTFACQGQVTSTLGPLKPFNEQDTVRLTVNLTDKTVSLEGKVVPFIRADDVHIEFAGTYKYEHTRLRSSATLHGRLNRISGALVANRILTFESHASKYIENYTYKMVCKPSKTLF
jgi:hypothetical protein